MGQYYQVVNIDKRQYLDPHKFGSGVKLMEFGNDGQSVMTAVAVLLADGNNRGGGDLRSDHPVIGSWAGDRLVVAGDYADEGRFVPGDIIDKGRCPFYLPTLYSVLEDNFEDISQTGGQMNAFLAL